MSHEYPSVELSTFAVIARGLLMREGDLVQHQPIAFFLDGIPIVAEDLLPT